MEFFEIVYGAVLLLLVYLLSNITAIGGGRVAAKRRRQLPQQREQRGRDRGRRFRRRRRVARREESPPSSASATDDENDDLQQHEEHLEADEGIGQRARRVTEYDENRLRKDAEREAREEQEAAKRLLKAEQRRQQEEIEAQKWAEFITVEETGEEEEETKEHDLLEAFIEVIKTQKIIALEDLAIEFEIRTQDVIHRIESLEAVGRLTGVMDDRGKYIYIAEAEMKRVAEYIQSKGRVSITELARASHRFVDLGS